MKNPFALLNEYELRHIAFHLDKCGKLDELHRMFALDTGVRENAWYKIKLKHNDLVGYVAELERARGHAEGLRDRTDVQRNIQGVGLQARYALIHTSINSLATVTPFRLIATLVKTGVWTSEQGTVYASRISDPESRSNALLELSTLLSDQSRKQVLMEAAGSAAKIENPATRAQHLQVLAPKLPLAERRVHLQQALYALLSIDYEERSYQVEERKIESLTSLIWQMLELGHAEDAIAAASHLAASGPNPDMFPRSETMNKIVHWLVQRGAYDDALKAARAAEWPQDRAHALLCIIPHLDEPARRHCVQEALMAARQIGEPDDLGADIVNSSMQEELIVRESRIPILGEIARYLPESDREPVIAEARRLAASCSDRRLADELLEKLEQHLKPVTSQAVRQARDDVLEIPADAPDRAPLPPRQAELLAPNIARLKFEEACLISDYDRRARDLLDLIPRLSKNLHRQAQRHALEAIKLIGNQFLQARNLFKLLQSNPEPRILGECLDLAKQNRDHESDRDQALGLLATLLASSGRANLAIEAASACYGGGHHDYRETALKRLSKQLAVLGKPVQAVVAAIQLRDEHERTKAIDHLAPHLTAAVLSAVLSRYMTDQSQHRLAINTLAPYFPSCLAENALRHSCRIGDADAQMRLRIALAPFLPTPMRHRELQRAVRDALRLAAKPVVFDADKQPLLDLIEDLSPELLLHVLQASFKIEVSEFFGFDHVRFWELCMHRLPSSRRLSVLRKICQVVDVVKFEKFIARVAVLLASWGAPEEAILRARRLSPRFRENTLVAISGHLNAEHLSKLLRQSKEEQWESAMQIPLIVQLGTVGLIETAFNAAMAMNQANCTEVLALLCPILSASRRSEALKILRTTRSANSSLVQASNLLATIPFLEASETQEVTLRARRIIKKCRWEWTRQSTRSVQDDNKKRHREQFVRLLVSALPSIPTRDRGYFMDVAFQALGHLSSRIQGQLLPKLAETLQEPNRTSVLVEAAIEIAKYISETPLSPSERNDLLHPIAFLFVPDKIGSTLRSIADSMTTAQFVRFLRVLDKWNTGWTRTDPTLALSLWKRALRDNPTQSRAEMFSLLTSLAPMVVDLVGKDAATEIYQAMRNVASWWP